ncbi:ComEC/Rec2 family competence protein [Candidatus Berkelbacteria bacterium]|nr:ComEC/Rec2 family competence protein [Candidatus Berkelbacteria bacterium]MBI4029912.1 ComEC/Rec2 family competence protein [Candidatus Berkelbacteria bacterium]
MHLPPSRVFFIFLVAFLIGVFAGSFFVLEFGLVLVFLGLISFLLTFGILAKEKLTKTTTVALAIFIFGILYKHELGDNVLLALDANKFAWLFALKNRFEGAIKNFLPFPQSVLLDGILLGSQEQIPWALKQTFVATGLSHILAVSGYNVTVVLKVWAEWTRFLGRFTSFILGLTAVFLFIILTGANETVVRAGIMGSMFLLAGFLGRQKTFRNITALTATIMVLQNPSILRFNLSFQLSFAALLGLLLISPLFQGWFRMLPSFIREAITATLGALIATFPLLLYHFGQFSLIALLVNVLVLPLIPLTMALGFGLGISGLFSEAIGRALSILVWPLLNYILSISQFFAQMPLAQIFPGKISGLAMAVYYLLLAFLIYSAHRRALASRN